MEFDWNEMHGFSLYLIKIRSWNAPPPPLLFNGMWCRKGGSIQDLILNKLVVLLECT